MMGAISSMFPCLVLTGGDSLFDNESLDQRETHEELNIPDEIMHYIDLKLNEAATSLTPKSLSPKKSPHDIRRVLSNKDSPTVKTRQGNMLEIAPISIFFQLGFDGAYKVHFVSHQCAKNVRFGILLGKVHLYPYH